jgi:putative FmdB family regulatory protein
MPTYDYACDACGGFDALRSLAQRDEPAACPGCSRASPRGDARPVAYTHQTRPTILRVYISVVAG